MRLLTLEIILTLDAQLLVKQWKTLPLHWFQAIFMAEISVVAQPLFIVNSMLHSDALLPQQGLGETDQFGGEVLSALPIRALRALCAFAERVPKTSPARAKLPTPFLPG